MLALRLASAATTGLAVLLLAISSASAATAYASTTVNVRSGAGTDFSVVDVLRPGERVEVDHCRGLWCFIEKPGANGWVNANYLDAQYDARDDYIIIERARRLHPVYRYPLSRMCWGGKNASFCVGN